MTDTHRLFVALPVPAWVRDDLEAAVAPLREDAPQLRWVEPAQWHLTLAFLGSVASADLAKVAGALAGSVGDGPNPTIGLDGSLGTFGRRVLWAGISPEPDLDVLAEAVRGALLPLGFADDKAFHAHLTVARAPKDQRVPQRLLEGFTGPTTRWRADQVNLMRSRPGPGGATYETVASWPLP